MVNTNFTNPVGLDGANGSHFSTAQDLYLLTDAAMKDPLIKNIVRTREYSFSDTLGDIDVDLTNTNNLLWEVPESIGIKTGTTSGAGEVSDLPL